MEERNISEQSSINQKKKQKKSTPRSFLDLLYLQITITCGAAIPIFLARSMALLFVLGSMDGGREMEAGLGTLDERDGGRGSEVECVLGTWKELGGARLLVRPRDKGGGDRGGAFISRESDVREHWVENVPDMAEGA